MKVAAGIPIRVTRRFTAPPERVYDAWLDPKTAGRWLFATPTGKVTKVEMDVRVDGRWCIVDRRPDGDARHFGQYLELNRPSRLVFSFSVGKYSTDGDPVVVEIKPVEGGCELTLTHTMKPEWAEYADRTREGWTGILEGLARTLRS